MDCINIKSLFLKGFFIPKRYIYNIFVVCKGLFISLFLVSYLHSSEFISPIPQNIDFDKAKSKLGEKLFFDPILSKDNTISCFSCHDIYSSGADKERVSLGINNQKGSLNAPTLFNAVFNFRQNWDGSAKTLSSQAIGPITNSFEMGHNFGDLIDSLNNTFYKKEFEAIYSDGVTKDNILDTLEEFQKTLITPNSPFDRYLLGDKSAISSNAKEGFALFKSKGCIVCHNGINIGGQLYSKFGMVELIDNTNYGLYNITKDEEDKYYFKVPTLRNIALSAPYFHNGSIDLLYDAVVIMLKYQVGRETSSEDIDKIVEFLHTLTGENRYAK
ncbi:MAG: cytochrome c peroxidase [Arcobacteraceae bacterium]|nr:c-type cytochrome [Arcobacteraceae bacterium]MDY0364858.1 cytochrome c peroxidase [Arcobacteraceae bacterium]